MLSQWYLQTASYIRLLSPHFPTICIKPNFQPFLAIFHHMCLLMSNPFTLCYFWQKCYQWVMLQWYLWTESYFRLLSLHFPAICHLSPFLAILHHLCLLKSKLGPISACIDKNIFTRCCCSDTCKEKANPGYYHPTFPALAWKFNFWPFLAIFHHLSLLMGHPLIPPPLLQT